MQQLTAAGVDCRPIVAGNFARNPVVNYFDYSIHDELPNSDAVSDTGFFIGNHHYDISTELKAIEKILRSAF